MGAVPQCVLAERHGRRRARHRAEGRRERGVQSGGVLQGHLAVLACHRHGAAGRCALWVRPSDLIRRRGPETSGVPSVHLARRISWHRDRTIACRPDRLGHPLHTPGGGGLAPSSTICGARERLRRLRPLYCTRYVSRPPRRDVPPPVAPRCSAARQPPRQHTPQRRGVLDAPVQRANCGDARRVETGAECGGDRRREGVSASTRVPRARGCSPDPGGARLATAQDSQVQR